MNRMLNNKKGITLVTVIIVVTVLVILSALLMQTVIYSLTLTKRHKNVDYTYYAGESAIENWFSVIKKVLNDQTIINSYPLAVNVSSRGSIEDYAKYLVGEVKKSGLLNDQYIDVAGVGTAGMPASASSAAVSLALSDLLELVKVEYNGETGQLYLSIGIKADSTFSMPGTPYKAGSKMVYAVKVFPVRVPIKDGLESAVWAIGDFFVKGINVDVKGDVFTFGSHPKDTLNMRQDFYGGIYAIDNGKLNIYGNAYSRSFIRTGPYLKNELDNSEIRVYKDSIAQCLQAFGNKDRIVTLRNAFTFDDIEINGDDTVIAVNGSYFGLSTGGYVQSHDQSSAIVNSAIVHSVARAGYITEGSKKSRITINRDVIVGGSTFKTDSEGRRIGLIEDASVAIDKMTDIPFYRSFTDKDWDDVKDVKKNYHYDLRESFSMGNLTGYLNQFQVWNWVDPFNSSAIEAWLNKIDTARGSISEASYFENNEDYLIGFSRNELIANNKIFMNTLSWPEDTAHKYEKSNFKTNLYVRDSFYLDNLFDESNRLKYGKQLVKDVDGKTKDEDGKTKKANYWEGITTAASTEEYLFGRDGRGGKCAEISKDLLGKVSKYATRDYPTTSGGDSADWILNYTDEFHKTLEAIREEYNRLLDGDEHTDTSTDLDDDDHILYIAYDEKGRFSTDTPEDLDKLFNENKTKDISVYDRSKDRTVDGGSEYFLVAIADPNVVLEINGSFNGIIITAGKIVLKENASIFGSIIAAGTGEYKKYEGYKNNIFVPRAEIIGTGNVEELDKGTYAAVKAIADSSSTGPYIDFFLGMSGDRNEYNKDKLLDVIDKATSTSEGKFLIPSDISKSDDEYMGYLNKAARINLLAKFKDLGIYLYDIF